jgi:transposase-like protein
MAKRLDMGCVQDESLFKWVEFYRMSKSISAEAQKKRVETIQTLF